MPCFGYCTSFSSKFLNFMLNKIYNVVVNLSKDDHFQIIKCSIFQCCFFYHLGGKSVTATNTFINCNTFSKVRFSPDVRIITFSHSYLIHPLYCCALKVRRRKKGHVVPLLCFLFYFPRFGRLLTAC